MITDEITQEVIPPQQQTSFPPNFRHHELNKTDWDVPMKYVDLIPIGCGAYGFVIIILCSIVKFCCF